MDHNKILTANRKSKHKIIICIHIVRLYTVCVPFVRRAEIWYIKEMSKMRKREKNKDCTQWNKWTDPRSDTPFFSFAPNFSFSLPFTHLIWYYYYGIIRIYCILQFLNFLNNLRIIAIRFNMKFYAFGYDVWC